MPRGVLLFLACLTPVLLFGMVGLVFQGSFLDGILSNAPLVASGAVVSWLSLRRWEARG